MIVAVATIVIVRAQVPIVSPQVDPLPQTLPGTVVPAPQPPSSTWWSVPLPAGANGPPVIAGDHVYVTRLPGTVVAYNIADGTEGWTADITPTQPLVVDGELVVVASRDVLHALRGTDGQTAWRAPIGELTAPLLAKDGWVIAASASKLTAIRASDGGQIWSVDSGPVRERGAILGDLLFVPLANGAIEARNLTTGIPNWQRRLGGVPQEPLAFGDRLFVGASDGVFYVLDTDAGEIEWKLRPGAAIRGAPVTDGERVYYVAVDHLVRALDYGHGALRWHTGIPFRPFTGPALVGNTLVLSGAVEEVHLLRAGDGDALTSIPLQQDLAVPPAVGTVKGVAVLAAVTGSLAESWRLTVIALPTAPASR